MMRLILVTTVALLGGSNALAQAAATTTATSATMTTTPTDPAAAAKATAAAKSTDRMICEHEEVLGSRLQGRRVCKTASQWAQERQEARDEVMRAQTMRGCGDGNHC